VSVSDFLAKITCPDLKAVARHWNSARGDRRVPAWGDLNPAEITGQLTIVWAYRFDAAKENFVGRLAGDRIHQLIKRNFHMMPMSEVYPESQFADMLVRCRRVVGTPALHIGQGLLFRDANWVGSGERVIMPLASDGVHGDGILGATDYRLDAAVTRASRLENPITEHWFEI
jgi:hypothetical protein